MSSVILMSQSRVNICISCIVGLRKCVWQLSGISAIDIVLQVFTWRSQHQHDSLFQTFFLLAKLRECIFFDCRLYIYWPNQFDVFFSSIEWFLRAQRLKALVTYFKNYFEIASAMFMSTIILSQGFNWLFFEYLEL